MMLPDDQHKLSLKGGIRAPESSHDRSLTSARETRVAPSSARHASPAQRPTKILFGQSPAAAYSTLSTSQRAQSPATACPRPGSLRCVDPLLPATVPRTRRLDPILGRLKLAPKLENTLFRLVFRVEFIFRVLFARKCL